MERLYNQTYQNFEIVVIDSGSTDRTLEIVKQFPVRLYQIKPEEFTYPYALNFGCQKAQAEKYFIILSAHSLPISSTWVEDGLKNFTSEKIMGVYGYIWSLPDATFWEKIIFNKYSSEIVSFFRKKEDTKNHLGFMGFTNAIVRKDLWKKYNFPEEYALGGEDGAWGRYWLNKGYYAIRDNKFSVQHTHGLGLVALLKQWKYWRSLNKPQPFKKLEFRR